MFTLFYLLFGGDNKNKKNDELEKKMDIFGLFDNEKEEVRKGNYNPWDFEEDDLEEDDYYYEDE